MVEVVYDNDRGKGCTIKTVHLQLAVLRDCPYVQSCDAFIPENHCEFV